jgi:DNA helicase-2/ATP-dependent DNA helicase PcrA
MLNESFAPSASTRGHRVRELVCAYRSLRDSDGRVVDVPTVVLKDPRTAAAVLAPLIADQLVEVFAVACLSTKHRLLAWHVLSRGTRANSIAIFYRVHAQSRMLEEAMRKGNVPYQIIGGMKFFERAEVKDLLAYLRLSVNPTSDADLARVINTPARGIGDKTVEHLLNVASESSVCAFEAIPQAMRELGTAASKKLGAFKTLIESFQLEATRLTPSELCGHILEVTGYRELLRKEDTAESDARLGNLEELVGSIQDYETETVETTPTLSGYLERVSLVAATDSQKSGPMVSLMTVHSAKGLEFDAVFLTGMEQEMFPYRGIASGEDEELEEERRLAYVAITRARCRLTITYAGMRTLFGQTRYLEKSQFLEDLPKSVIKLEGSPRAARSAGGNAGARYGAGYVGGYSPGGYRSRGDGGFQGQRYAARGLAQDRPALAPGSRVVERDEYAQAASGEGQAVRPGSHVRHVRFGEGVVQSVEGGMKPSVVASFPGYGEKRILLEFLEPA